MLLLRGNIGALSSKNGKMRKRRHRIYVHLPSGLMWVRNVNDNMKDILKKYVGAACEVKTLDNDLLFLGRLRSIVDDLSLSVDIISSDDSPLFTWRYGVPVKLSLYKGPGNILIAGGKVYMANADFWRVSNIIRYQNFERRSFFRVQANTGGLVSRACEEGEEVEKYQACIINISLSGVMFSSAKQFAENETVVAESFFLAEDRKPFALSCIVKHSDDSPTGLFMHRCQFLDIGEMESDRLCRAIFSLQREAIKKRKSYL